MSSPKRKAAKRSHVHHIDGSESAEQLFKDNEAVLMAITHEKWNYTERFIPEFEKAAQELERSGSSIRCARLECSIEENRDISHDCKFVRFPSLVVVRGRGNTTLYKGILRAAEMASFGRRLNMPSVAEVDATGLESLRRENDVVVVVFLPADDDGTLAQEFVEMASEMKNDYVFAITRDPKVGEAEDISKPSIIIYKTVAEPRKVLEGIRDKESMMEFVREGALPLVPELHPENFREYSIKGSIKKLGYIFVASPSDALAAQTAILPLAREHAGYIRFCVVLGDENERLVIETGVEAGKWPMFVLHDTSRNLKYPMPQPESWSTTAAAGGDGDDSGVLRVADIEPFVKDYVAGKLTSELRSAPVPESQGFVVEVVGKTYHDVVLDDDKDVLLEYYRDDCGPCKTAAPQLEKLGQLLRQSGHGDKLTVGKTNRNRNDSPDMAVYSVPTFKMYAAGRKDKPVVFQGENVVEEWVKFIKESGTYGIELK